MIDGILKAAAGNKGLNVRLFKKKTVRRIGEEVPVKKGSVFYDASIGQGHPFAFNGHHEAVSAQFFHRKGGGICSWFTVSGKGNFRKGLFVETFWVKEN